MAPLTRAKSALTCQEGLDDAVGDGIAPDLVRGLLHARRHRAAMSAGRARKLSKNK